MSILWALVLAGGIALVVAWVAGVATVAGDDGAPDYDSWDNGLATLRSREGGVVSVAQT